MAKTPVETNFNELFANPDKYATLYSEGSQSLYLLLKYVFEEKIKTISCCRGDNSKYAYIYFTCLDEELTFYKIVLNKIKANNKIKDFNFEIRAFVNFKNCENLRGVIFRCDPTTQDEMFKTILNALPDRAAVSKYNIIDYFSSLLFNMGVRNISIKDTKLIYENGHYYIRFFEQLKTFHGYQVYLTGNPKNYNELLNAVSIEDLAGLYKLDKEEDLRTINKEVIAEFSRLGLRNKQTGLRN